MLGQGVVDISRRGHFSLSEANEILPIIIKFTLDSSQIVDQLIAKLEAVNNNQTHLISELEAEINDHINAWHAKVRKLGGIPKGLWIVDFDSSDGYWCWKYPEPEVKFWHAYGEGFSARIPVEEKPVKKPVESDGPSIFRGL